MGPADAAAVEAHLEAILDESAYARVVIRICRVTCRRSPRELMRLRDRYEEDFALSFGERDVAGGLVAEPGAALPARRA